jgi:hypothetical protein
MVKESVKWPQGNNGGEGNMFTFQEVSEGILDATIHEWASQIADLPGDVIPAYYSGVLDLARKCAEGQADQGIFMHALIRDGETHACALCYLSYVKKPLESDRWLKLLAISVEPKLEVSSTSEGVANIQELSRIASAALVETLGKTYEAYPCGLLKVYGRTPFTVTFLEGVTGNLEEDDVDGLKIFRQGNWLILEKA